MALGMVLENRQSDFQIQLWMKSKFARFRRTENGRKRREKFAIFLAVMDFLWNLFMDTHYAAYSMNCTPLVCSVHSSFITLWSKSDWGCKFDKKYRSIDSFDSATLRVNRTTQIRCDDERNAQWLHRHNRRCNGELDGRRGSSSIRPWWTCDCRKRS